MGASGRGAGQGGGVRVILLARALFGHRHEEAVLISAIEGLEGHPGKDPVLEQALHHPLGRLRQREGELLEEGRAELELHPGDFGERLRRVVGLGGGELARLAQADLAHDGHVKGGHERAEGHVGADVRGGLLAPDVLLARLEGEEEAGRAVRPRGGAAWAPGHRRTSSCLTANTPRLGPPKVMGTPRPCPSPTTMSAPSAPGGVRRARFTGSAATTSRAPAAWAISATAFTSSRPPEKFGYGITTAAACAFTTLRSASRSVAPSPSAAERSRRPGPST